ncbi:4-hydroxybenzoate 3-monooxygenase [Amycolatopsis acidiphila]|uniref:4-hydroxybenzoate 3-monooxygenase n=1 Tax=Amycolatopsis acidiphila TaxID=715473 RepID=A0A558AEN3_9PSEU|nr:4-hydroxybenzoate 3-monooxygenase [Amycolatopsis acidiphila]TVT22683.1 4-hydroxybenzoate 3-monooxygenase [Amycolatopsis acidiphila]UIJ59553.1 4-hydroxybenzoate 3-monooxygenase [Amycolatopsis acidiphila]GHG80578.1 4-hydroxybenzoate 3-monooxygenase [Amycolatopsis acidiphila]
MARTQVGIIGAGPAGLLLSYLLHAEGVDAVVLESRSRDYVEKRVRAGVCEHPTVELLRDIGVGTRMDAEGLPHHGFSLRFDGEDHRIALSELTGRTITVYGQQEIVKDLIAAHEAKGYPVEFEVSDVELHELDTENPHVTYRDVDGVARQLDCDVIAGCDGFHGVSRPTVPAERVKFFNREYPFAWLGVLARTPPSHEELIYTHHERGFALHSMRSPEITRLYLQVPFDEKIDEWSDDRIWSELSARLATSGEFALREGPILDKGITPMRSFVAEPMQYGRLFLAGDAAHIVPPTGAKGMNLAIADVRVLSRALVELLQHKRSELAQSYSDTCLKRVWRAEHFSWYMTSMLHVDPAADDFQRRLQLSQLRYTAASTAAATSLAENYVGLPFE